MTFSATHPLSTSSLNIGNSNFGIHPAGPTGMSGPTGSFGGKLNYEKSPNYLISKILTDGWKKDISNIVEVSSMDLMKFGGNTPLWLVTYQFKDIPTESEFDKLSEFSMFKFSVNTSIKKEITKAPFLIKYNFQNEYCNWLTMNNINLGILFNPINCISNQRNQKIENILNYQI